MAETNSMQEWVPELHGAFEKALAQFLSEHPLRAQYSNGLTQFYTDLQSFVTRRAKRIRPLLFLISHRIFTGAPPPIDPALLRAAVSLELFHSFILIHDDIIDRSDRRRGEATLHRMLETALHTPKPRADRARLGVNAALVLGDILFALAVETMLEAGFPAERTHVAVSAFLRYVGETGRGELLDVLHSARDVSRVSVSEIQRTYALKTTKYTFECPMVLGAILAGAPKSAQNVLVQFARPVGLAFQIQNDLNEFRDERASGKEIVEDLFEGKKTLLIRKAYDRLGKSDRLFLQTCFDATRLTEAAINRIRELVMSSGAFAELEEDVNRLFAEAVSIIGKSRFTEVQQTQVLETLEFLKSTTLAKPPSSTARSRILNELSDRP
jgi:geranylgeranyl diphosphate synthase type I